MTYAEHLEYHNGFVRAFDEHALRFMQAERDYPQISHKGTEPLILQRDFMAPRFEQLRRDFQRTA